MKLKQRLLIAARAVRQHLDYTDSGFIPIRQEDASLRIPISDLEGSLLNSEKFEFFDQLEEALLSYKDNKIKVVYKGHRQSSLLAETGPFVLIMSPGKYGRWYNVYFPDSEKPMNLYIILT